jgi:hypothetical protein
MGLATLSIVVLASAAVVTHSQQDHADDGGSGEGSSAAYPISDASSMGTAAAAAAAAAIPMPVVDIETVPGQLMKLSELSDAEPGTGVTRLIFTEKDVAGRRGARIRRVFFRAKTSYGEAALTQSLRSNRNPELKTLHPTPYAVHSELRIPNPAL